MKLEYKSYCFVSYLCEFILIHLFVFLPEIVTSPLDGLSRVPIIFISVDFPLPDWPTIEMKEDSSIARFIPCSTSVLTTVPYSFLYLFSFIISAISYHLNWTEFEDLLAGTMAAMVEALMAMIAESITNP